MRKVHLRVPGWDLREVPDEAMSLAENRTAHLQGIAMQSPLQYLLASAYLQGVEDCAQAVENDRRKLRDVLR